MVATVDPVGNEVFNMSNIQTKRQVEHEHISDVKTMLLDQLGSGWGDVWLGSLIAWSNTLTAL